MDKSIQIELDKESLNNLNRQFEALNTTMNEASANAVYKVLMAIKTTAQLYLKGRGHIVSSRLRNSIYVQMKNRKETAKNKKTYSDKSGKSYDAEMKSVILTSNFEGAVGTNVEYAAGIEFGYPAKTIKAKNGGMLSFLPSAKGEAWFTSKTRSSLKKYYADGSGNITLKQNRVFVKEVKHPGFAGDSYLYRALKTVDVTKTMAEEMRNSLKYGKYLKKGAVNRHIGNAMTNAD